MIYYSPTGLVLAVRDNDDGTHDWALNDGGALVESAQGVDDKSLAVALAAHRVGKL